MKYKVKDQGSTQKVIEIYIPKETVSEELEKIYLEISKTANLPGFRAGKAPLALIKERYKKAAEEEMMRNLTVDSLNRAIDESKIDILGYPEVFDFEFENEKGISYKATVNLRPNVKIKSYKGLSIKKYDTEIKEQDIDSYITNLREIGATFKTKEGVAKKGDYIIADMDCLVEGKPTEIKQNTWLYVDDDSYIPGKVIEGLKVDDERDAEKTLPDNYSNKELAGKKANFHIKVKELKEKILPELNDEFAKTMGDFANMAELREALRENLKRQHRVEERKNYEKQIMSQLDKSSVFEVPKAIVDNHLERLVDEAKHRLKHEKYSEDDIRSKESEMRERLKEEANREVRMFFIIDEISRLENITASDDDLEIAFKNIAQSSGHAVAEVKKHYEEKELIDDLKSEIRHRKVFDFLVQSANIN